MRLPISPTPSNTPSNTPQVTPSNSSCPNGITPTPTSTSTTPTPTVTNTSTPTNTPTFNPTPSVTTTITSTPTNTPTFNPTPSVTTTITSTPTPTPTTEVLYDVYTADEYSCPGCTVLSSGVLVAFPAGQSVTIGRWYPDEGDTSHTYLITGVSSGAGYILTNIFGSFTSCGAACAL